MCRLFAHYCTSSLLNIIYQKVHLSGTFPVIVISYKEYPGISISVLENFSFLGTLQLLHSHSPWVSTSEPQGCLYSISDLIRTKAHPCPLASSLPITHLQFCQACVHPDSTLHVHSPGSPAIITPYGIQKSTLHTAGTCWLHNRAEYLQKE